MSQQPVLSIFKLRVWLTVTEYRQCCVPFDETAVRFHRFGPVAGPLKMGAHLQFSEALVRDHVVHGVIVAFFLATYVVGLQAQQQVAATQSAPADKSTEDLAKATQNPVANMISVPVQNNDNFGIGPYDRIQNVLNIQPVVPVKLGSKVNLIVRPIIPIISQPAPGTADLESLGIDADTPAYFAAVEVQQHASVFGFGDITPQLFLTPSAPHKVIFGVGPMLVFPSATGYVLGQGKFSMGPTVVVLAQPGQWTVGALVSNVWSVAGDSSRSAVNQMSLQYFVNYNLKKGWVISSGPIIMANWEASPGKVWTVPFGGGVGRIMKLGFQPVNISTQLYGNAVHPTAGSSWSLRMQIAFLFPKIPPEMKARMKAAMGAK